MSIQSLSYAQVVVSIAFYIFGILGAISALISLRLNRQNQRENGARRAYLDYVQLSIGHPTWAFPPLISIDLNTQTIDGARERFEQYEWFVSSTIATANFILESSRRDRIWNEMMILQLAYHWRYLEHFRSTKPYLIIWDRTLSREFDDAIAIGKTKF
jgi:hypothetical protein